MSFTWTRRTLAGALLVALSASLCWADAPTGRYELSGCRGTVVKDKATGFEWQRATLRNPKDGTGRYPMGLDAVAACTSSPLEGGGWRLPSLFELSTLEDQSRVRVDAANGPHVDLRYFKDTFADYYVSSTHVGLAYWSFNFGKVDPDTNKSGDPERVDPAQPIPGRPTTGYVRCVRRSK